MSLLAPAALLLSALSIPIILLYMLRLRRTEVPISSNFLWQQLVVDREANAPWQRLRPSWLLLLQLLILAVLVFALARPSIEVETISSGQIIMLLDASASMNATDVDEDNRFEQAQDAAIDIIDTLSDSDSMTIIRVSDVPEVLISATDDQPDLRRAIRDAEPSDTGADWVAAMTLAAGGARNVEDFEVVVVTDGGLPGGLPEIPGEIRLVTVGAEPDNVAITALSTRSISGGGTQLFSQLINYGDRTTEVVFSLSLDGDLFDARTYTASPGVPVSIITENLPEDFTEIEASISIAAASDVPDYLETDDVAYAVFNPTGAGEVLLMSPRNIFLEQIYSRLPGVTLTRADPADGIPNGEFDLIVLDGWLPNNLPDTDLLIINPPNNTALFNTGAVVEDLTQAAPSSILQDDPRTQYLDFADVNIRAFKPITNYDDWADVLVDGVGGPLIIAGEVDDRQVAVLTFALQDSDLPLQIAWPILISNLTQWYTPPRILTVTENVTPGDAVPMRGLTGDEIRVTLPDGETREFELEDSSQMIFADTSQVGIYAVEVRQEDRVLTQEAFAVNLFDALESRIIPQTAVTIGTQNVTEAAQEETGQRELWPYLAVIGLVILLIEWVYYHRHALRRRRTTSRFGRRGLT